MTGNGDATRLDMYFCPLYSGSSGNALFCQYGNTRLLIDAGKSGKTIEDALASIGADIRTISGVLIPTSTATIFPERGCWPESITCRCMPQGKPGGR